MRMVLGDDNTAKLAKEIATPIIEEALNAESSE